MAEFTFNIQPLFPETIVKLNAEFLRRFSVRWMRIIDEMGVLSAQAQGLNNPITTHDRLKSAPEQVLYMAADTMIGDNGAVNGFIKSGSKSLFLCDRDGFCTCFPDAPCVLDFYVHETQQRRGLGKLLFERMIADEKKGPGKYAIDRPSAKMLSFLKKHYGLEDPINQTNNFVVYDAFFENETEQPEPAEQKNTYKKDDTEDQATATVNRYAAKPTTHEISKLLHHL